MATCAGPLPERTLTASFALSHPSDGKVIKTLQKRGGDENKALLHPLKNINDKKLSNDSAERDNNKEQVTGSIYLLFILL